jgi:Rrf2 family protein
VRLSEGVEWGVHCATVLALLPPGEALPAGRLAEFHGIPVAYLAKHLQALSRAGILEAVQGPGGGYRLARPAAQITALDVVEAIDGTEPAFQCTEIRRRGPGARPGREYRTLCGVHRLMLTADNAWRTELRRTSIADLAADAAHNAPPKAIEQAARWYQEVSR